LAAAAAGTAETVGPASDTGARPEAGLIGWREIRTVLDKGTQVNGKPASRRRQHRRRLRGEVRATDLLEVAACGVVHGSIWAKTLIIAGEVRGQVLGADRVEIQTGARIRAHRDPCARHRRGRHVRRRPPHEREETVAKLDQPARG
jgi:hypothetical protein